MIEDEIGKQVVDVETMIDSLARPWRLGERISLPHPQILLTSLT
jgi:hypothetical protein